MDKNVGFTAGGMIDNSQMYPFQMLLTAVSADPLILRIHPHSSSLLKEVQAAGMLSSSPRSRAGGYHLFDSMYRFK
jgi:hypothetical protein